MAGIAPLRDGLRRPLPGLAGRTVVACIGDVACAAQISVRLFGARLRGAQGRVRGLRRRPKQRLGRPGSSLENQYGVARRQRFRDVAEDAGEHELRAFEAREQFADLVQVMKMWGRRPVGRTGGALIDDSARFPHWIPYLVLVACNG